MSNEPGTRRNKAEAERVVVLSCGVYGGCRVVEMIHGRKYYFSVFLSICKAETVKSVVLGGVVSSGGKTVYGDGGILEV